MSAHIVVKWVVGAWGRIVKFVWYFTTLKW